jgi:hypothetical protein
MKAAVLVLVVGGILIAGPVCDIVAASRISSGTVKVVFTEAPAPAPAAPETFFPVLPTP